MINLVLALTLFATGCAPGPQLVEKPASSGSSTTVSKPTTDSGTTVVKQDPPVTTEPQPAQQDKRRFIPERVFQVSKLQKATVKLDKHEFHLWVMDTEAKRQEGMMFLRDTDFKDDEGMIFVFSDETERRFWMHNTLVDLDICYCDKKGKIIKTYTMAKLDETTDYSSHGDSKYVIELRSGLLKKLEIKEGMKFEIPDEVVSKD